MLIIWSSLDRNRSPSLVVSCSFGRIVSSKAAIESQLAGRRNRKPKTQGSGASDRQTLQSKICRYAENRFAINRLGVVHGRRNTAIPAKSSGTPQRPAG